METYKNFWDFLKHRLKEGWVITLISCIYIAFCWGSCIYFFIDVSVYNGLLALIFPLIVVIVYIVEYWVGIRLVPIFAALLYINCLSNILGNGYGLYFIWAPYFDKVMHCLSGFVFTALGYSLTKIVAGNDKGSKFAACIIGAFCFCLACAAVWEMYEYAAEELGHTDLQSNYVITHVLMDDVGFKSVYQTVITYTDGTQSTIDGYVDIGFYDTLQDILVCAGGSVITMLMYIIERACGKSVINRNMTPKVLPRRKKKDKEQPLEPLDETTAKETI